MGVLDGSALPDRTPPVEVRVRHATVGRLAPGTDATAVAEAIVGLPVAVRPRGVLAAAVRALG